MSAVDNLCALMECDVSVLFSRWAPHAVTGFWRSLDRAQTFCGAPLPRHLRPSAKSQPFKRVYNDAFAGTGDRTEKRRENLPLFELPELDAVTKGSARLALEVDPPFDDYVLIERAVGRASELTALVEAYPDRKITIVNADANQAIADLCRTTNWQKTRGVVFLDPYGLQVDGTRLLRLATRRRSMYGYCFQLALV